MKGVGRAAKLTFSMKQIILHRIGAAPTGAAETDRSFSGPTGQHLRQRGVIDVQLVPARLHPAGDQPDFADDAVGAIHARRGEPGVKLAPGCVRESKSGALVMPRRLVSNHALFTPLRCLSRIVRLHLPRGAILRPASRSTRRGSLKHGCGSLGCFYFNAGSFRLTDQIFDMALRFFGSTEFFLAYRTII